MTNSIQTNDSGSRAIQALLFEKVNNTLFVRHEERLQYLNAVTSGMFSFSDAFNIQNPLKIAVVKQSVYGDAYISTGTGSHVVISSPKHLGPAGLFIPNAPFNTDFFVLSAPSECLECQTWMRKEMDCKWAIFSSLNHTRDGICPYDIDWTKYDIVISFDIAIPFQITETTHSTLWTYFVTEGCMKLQNEFAHSGGNGYDLYLTQNVDWQNCSLQNCLHFPYTFVLPDLMHLLFNSSSSVLDMTERSERKCTFAVERHTDLTGLEIYDCQELGYGGKMTSVLEVYRSAKFYVVFLKAGAGIRGNAIYEAACSGSLVIGKPIGVINHILFTSKTRADIIPELSLLIQRLNNSHTEYVDALKEQQQILWEHVFARPMGSLYGALLEKRRFLQSRLLLPLA